MKTINKIASSLAVVALFASCAEKQLPDSDVTPVSGVQSEAVVPTEIVATFEATKVSYNEYDAGSVFNLRPTWEVGDEIIALDEGGANYHLSVRTVNTDNSAILSGEAPADCKLHLIYCPGVSASNLSVNYAAQTGVQKTMPAVMFSDGVVQDGRGHFTFRNAGGIVGISAVKGIPQGTTVTKITVSGENLSSATIALRWGALSLTATKKADDAISVDGLNLTVTDANGTLSSPVLVAVPAGAVIAKVSVPLTKEAETMRKPSATPQEGVDYVTIAGIKWAKWNIGAKSSEHPETDYGWYFPFAGTEGYMRYAGTWQSVKATSVEFSYSPSSAYTVIASDYVYVKDQTFVSGYSFDCTNTPYHIGSDTKIGWTKYVHSGCSSYWWPAGGTPDNKMTLDPEDDAARVNWGGTWRIATRLEFQTLNDNTTSEWIDNYNGTGINGRLLTSTAAGEAGHSIFFPAVGYGDGSIFGLSGDYGFYRTSSLWDREADEAYEFYVRRDAAGSKDPNFRCLGMAVRPILE